MDHRSIMRQRRVSVGGGHTNRFTRTPPKHSYLRTFPYPVLVCDWHSHMASYPRQSRTPILLMTFQWPEQRVIDNAVNLGKRSIPRDCQYVDIVQANVSASIKLVESCARTGDCYLRPRPLPPPRIHVPFESETVSSDTCEHATAFVAGE